MIDELDLILREICKHGLEMHHTNSTENQQLAKEFLKLSKDDLRACSLLYREGLFALATYHLQQSVEKATKAYMLAIGVATVNEVRKIGHDSLKGHMLYARKLAWVISRLSKFDSSINVDLAEIDKIRKKKRLEITRLDASEINKVISKADAVSKSIEIKLPQITRITQEIVIDSLVGGKQGSTQSKEDIVNIRQIIERIISLTKILPFLFVASLITFPHAEFTRYPDGVIKPWEYGMSMGIIVLMPEMIRRMDETFTALERVKMDLEMLSKRNHENQSASS